MFAAERLAKIREILLEYKHIDISTLSSILSVSEATIRRDFEKLEEEGFLTKTHGGAVINDEAEQEVQLSSVEDPYINEKRQIGMIAAQMIYNGDVVFLGAGVTCLQIAKNIKSRKELTVVTNSINILLEFNGCSNITVILLGGNMQTTGPSISLVGQFAKKMLEGIFIGKAFFTVNGVHLDYGYTVSSAEIAELYNVLLKNADELYVVADYTKFNKRALTPLGDLKLADKIITNAQVSLDYKKFFFENDIQMFTAFDEDKDAEE